ncbi:MAG: Gfo/Idh/MocA family oxidoreductase [Candidatus Sumerlaeia bacterium]|nr:Gfo/Idh/MocA family oxidoreductase [Candidatus Sumerlaeia bacterium]
MHKITRREFVKSSAAAGMALGLSRAARPAAKAASPNAEVRLAIVGLGGIDVPGSVGGRGRQLIEAFGKVLGARIAALCDVDQTILDHGVALVKQSGDAPAAYRDIRKLLEAKDIDAVVVALPNHWHALATVWACQAGKDVYVEKPMAYSIWEGRQIVAAAQKYGRIVQVGMQGRSSPGLREAFEFIRSGQIGKIRYVHVIVYRQRDGIGKVTAPTPIPPTVDYDLWCGPAPMGPLKRKELHYDWHWFWATGNGEIGNNGVHYIDMCRWALGNPKMPRRVISFGGRFLYDDDGETPNTHVAFLEGDPAPMICELRGLPEKKGAKAAGKHRNLSTGILIQCEGGYFAGTHPGGKVFDNQNKEMKEFGSVGAGEIVIMHVANFIEAVRSRKADQLHAPAIEGHLSAASCHLANISYRLGAAAPHEAIRDAVRANSELADAAERCREHLAANGADLSASPLVLGPWLAFDPDAGRFVGETANAANALTTREYRPPFVVPEMG